MSLTELFQLFLVAFMGWNCRQIDDLSTNLEERFNLGKERSKRYALKKADETGKRKKFFRQLLYLHNLTKINSLTPKIANLHNL